MWGINHRRVDINLCPRMLDEASCALRARLEVVWMMQRQRGCSRIFGPAQSVCVNALLGSPYVRKPGRWGGDVLTVIGSAEDDGITYGPHKWRAHRRNFRTVSRRLRSPRGGARVGGIKGSSDPICISARNIFAHTPRLADGLSLARMRYLTQSETQRLDRGRSLHRPLCPGHTVVDAVVAETELESSKRDARCHPTKATA